MTQPKVPPSRSRFRRIGSLPIVVAILALVVVLRAQVPRPVTGVFVAAPPATSSQSQFVTCTTTVANLTQSTVQTAMNSAADGDTICLPAGSASWSTQLVLSATKAVTIAGRTAISGASGTTSITQASGINGLIQFPSTTTSKRYRFTGISWTQTAVFMVWTCTTGGCTNVISQFRFDHNVITDNQSGSTIFLFGEDGSSQFTYGVMDHNTVNCSQSCDFLQYIGNPSVFPPPPLGTVNNLFIEDNTFTIASITDLGTGCTDGWGGMAMVYRHNTSTNCRVITHGATHSGGPSNVETYSNIINETSSGGVGCYRCIHHQGSGTFLAWDNVMNCSGGCLPRDGDPAAFLDYRGAPNAIDGMQTGATQCDGTRSNDGNRAPTTTNRGYPCWHQPARDVTTAYKPMYFWNNRWNDGSKIDMSFDFGGSGSPDYGPNHVQLERDYYLSVSASAQSSTTSPFNGTSGMGFGTLANRPTTCTTSSETSLVAAGAGAGVGYFATDQGAQGTLYTCSNTNTWTVYYTPYQYPFPWP